MFNSQSAKFTTLVSIAVHNIALYIFSERVTRVTIFSVVEVRDYCS